MNEQKQYSDYIAYVDESGDHGLGSINPDFPVFVLSFRVFQKKSYVEGLTPVMRSLKFKTFGHDMAILHEHDIRKKTGVFSMMSKEPREIFMEELNGVIHKADFTLIAVVIHKARLKEQYATPAHPYHLAMEYGLERVHRFLKGQGQDEPITCLVFEARGKKEDEVLELEFRRVCAGENYFQKPLPFEIIMADKKSNSEGLQLADMTARPIGLSVIRPKQPNRAMDILEGKFYRDRSGRKEGFGLKVFP